MNHLSIPAYLEDGELFVYRCPLPECGSTGEAGSCCHGHEPPIADAHPSTSTGIERKRVRVPEVGEGM
jgi:hypothetical protein